MINIDDLKFDENGFCKARVGACMAGRTFFVYENGKSIVIAIGSNGNNVLHIAAGFPF